MIKVIYCPNCGKPLQIPEDLLIDDFFICPSCKSEFTNPYKIIRKKTTPFSSGNLGLTKKQGYWLITAAIIIIIALIGSLYNNRHNNTGNSVDSTQDEIYYTNEGYGFALSKEIYDRMMEYIVHKDLDALNKLIDAGLVITLPKNTEVFLINAGFGSTAVRPKGKTIKLWTTNEAIHQ